MDSEEIIDEEESEKPLEVTIKKEDPPKEPDFDYDDYTPTDTEILEIETEMSEKIKKATKNG